MGIWAQECLACQCSKVHSLVHVQPTPIEVPARHFSHIHVDLVGPLPTSLGYSYLFTIIDRTTRLVEAVPLSATSMINCTQTLFKGFGMPAVLTSDRRAQFTSAVWCAVCNLLGVVHITTTAYHPEGNGIVERLHRSLKAALSASCSSGDWVDQLPKVPLGLRAAPREEDALSPPQAVFGTPLILPGQFLSQAKEPLGSFLKTLKNKSGSEVCQKTLSLGTTRLLHVWCCSTFQRSWHRWTWFWRAGMATCHLCCRCTRDHPPAQQPGLHHPDGGQV